MTDKLSEDTVNIRIPRWLKEKLKKEAQRRLAPVSQIVREAIAEKLHRVANWQRDKDNIEP